MKKQLVTIDFKKNQGVILKWNYVDLSKRSKFFRHIIVLLTSKLEVASRALEEYIKYIKLGDLYTTIYCSESKKVKMKQWREKTNRSESSSRGYLREESIVSFTLDEAFPIIQEQIQQINQPTIVNFILQQQGQIAPLKDRIKHRQIENKIRFISTIFSPQKLNYVSISEGVNTLSLDSPFVYQFYHHYINQMAIEFAHLVVTCRNGEISSCTQTDWKNTAFNQIERSYYGPSIRYQKDVLHFVNAKTIPNGSYELQISLHYKCFDGCIYTSQKKIAINFDHGEIYNRTVSMPKKGRIYYSTQDIELEESPYESETLIYFDRMVEEKKSQQ